MISKYLINGKFYQRYDFMSTNFMSSKDTDEERAMRYKIDNIEIMINDKADEVIKKKF